MNLTVPGAVSALEAAFSGLIRCAGPEAAADLIEDMIEGGDCREGANAMARARSWVYSGFGLPPRTREGSISRAGRERREKRLAAFASSQSPHEA